jgi:hypothetical protein
MKISTHLPDQPPIVSSAYDNDLCQAVIVLERWASAPNNSELGEDKMRLQTSASWFTSMETNE